MCDVFGVLLQPSCTSADLAVMTCSGIIDRGTASNQIVSYAPAARCALCMAPCQSAAPTAQCRRKTRPPCCRTLCALSPALLPNFGTPLVVLSSATTRAQRTSSHPASNTICSSPACEPAAQQPADHARMTELRRIERTSGAIQRYVPVSAVMTLSLSISRATPKSAILTCRFSSSSKFAALRSLWMMPR